MEKSRFTEEKIVFALKQAEPGTSVPDVCRKLGISDSTSYACRKKYGVISPSELKHMRQLETGRGNPASEETGGRSEPRQSDAAGRTGKKELTLARPREWGRDLQARYRASERQVCFALRVSYSSYRYCSVAADDSALCLRDRRNLCPLWLPQG